MKGSKLKQFSLICFYFGIFLHCFNTIHAQVCPRYNSFTTDCPNCETNLYHGCMLFSNPKDCISTSYGKCQKENDSDGCTYQCLYNVIQEAKYFVLFLEDSNKINAKGDTKSVYVDADRFGKLKLNSNVKFFQLVGYGLENVKKGKVFTFQLDNEDLAANTNIYEVIIMNINLKDLGNNRLPKKIEFLRLDNCNLNSFPEDLTAETNIVADLDLRRNQIMEFPVQETPMYKALNKLRKLNLADNNLEDYTLFLPKLESLDLSNNKLSILPNVLYDKKTQLTSLFIQGNQIDLTIISSKEYDFFRDLTELEADFPSTSKCLNNHQLLPLNYKNKKYFVCVHSGKENLNESDDEKESEKTSDLTILFIVIGVMIGVGIIIFFVWKRKTRKQMDLEVPILIENDLNSSKSSLYEKSWICLLESDEILMKLKIPFNELTLLNILASGAFGEVWKGQYNSEIVAVKRILPERTNPDEAEDFIHEIKLMARMRHPRIVKFIGITWTKLENLSAISEYMECGDLHSLLRNQKVELSWKHTKLRITMDIVEALVYLHTLNPLIIHRDLKSKNILVDSKLRCKLSDFGLSRRRSLEDTMTCGIGTFRWIAPEIALGERYTEKADIYSFGVVISEIQTRQIPYHDALSSTGAKLSEVALVHEVAKLGLRPDFGLDCPSTIYKLAQDCMLRNPDERPSAKQILDRLIYEVTDEIQGLKSIELVPQETTF